MLVRKKWPKAPQAKPNRPIRLDATEFVHGGHASQAESTNFSQFIQRGFAWLWDFVLCLTASTSAPLHKDHFGFHLVAFQTLSCTL